MMITGNLNSKSLYRPVRYRYGIPQATCAVAAAVKAVLTVRGAGTGPGLVPGRRPRSAAARAAPGAARRRFAFRFTHYRVVSFPSR